MFRINPVLLQKFISGAHYPASKQALLDNAKNLDANEDICSAIEQLPDCQFQTPMDVSQAFGKRYSEAEDSTFSSASCNEFLGQAVENSLVEIEVADLALHKTENEAIRIFARKLMSDHIKLGHEIVQLCDRKRIDLPRVVGSEKKAKIQALSSLSREDFDRKFIEHNVKDHETDINMFHHCAEQEDDDDIKTLADQGAKMFMEHLDIAKQIEKSM